MSLRPLRAALAQWSPKPGLLRDPLYVVSAAWPEIVGAQVAAQCAPVALRGDALVVATGSSAWSQELQLLSPTILAAVQRLAPGAPVARLLFRSGRFRPAERRGPEAAHGTKSRPSVPPLEPAADAWDALERVRRRLNRLRRAAPAQCAYCSAPQAVEAGAGDLCAPCAGAARSARSLATQRVLYVTPWLGYAALREQLPALGPGEYEHARRHLLARWWAILERARQAERLCASGFERRIASSYVLLRSQLPPDRITAAIVRNLLGAELEGLAFGEALPWGTTSVASKNNGR